MIQVSFGHWQGDIKSLTKFVPALKMDPTIFSFGKGLTGWHNMRIRTRF